MTGAIWRGPPEGQLAGEKRRSPARGAGGPRPQPSPRAGRAERGSRGGWRGPRPGSREGPRDVALGSARPGDRALSRELLRSPLCVVRARERCQEGDEVVDLVLRERERLDVLVEERVLHSVALVVVVHDVPEGHERAVVHV